MAKKKPENQEQADAVPAKPKKPVQRAAPGTPWHPAWRILVSLLLVFHLMAVFVAPWDLSTKPALPPDYFAATDSQGEPPPLPPRDSTVWQQPIVPRTLGRFFHHYLNLAYLNNGYEFFAPNPTGSNLIHYQVWDSEGDEIAVGEFPSTKEQWPRLFYHRHMMLAAQHVELGPAAGHHFAKHLIRINNGKTSRVDWIYHKLLSQRQVLDETPLDAKSTYVVLGEIHETAEVGSQPAVAEPSVLIPGGGQ